MQLNIEANVADEIQNVLVEGEVDVSNADELRVALDSAIDSGHSVVMLDLAQVPYIDSTGIGVLVGASHKANDNGISLNIAHVQASTLRIMKMLGVDVQLTLV